MNTIRSTGFHSGVTEPPPAEYLAQPDDVIDDGGDGASSVLIIVGPVCLAAVLVVIITLLSTYLIRRRSRRKQYLRVSYANQQNKAINQYNNTVTTPEKYSTLSSPDALGFRSCARATLEDLCQSLASFDKDSPSGITSQESPGGMSNELNSSMTERRDDRDTNDTDDENAGCTSTADRKRVSRSLPALNAHCAALNFAMATPPAKRHVTTGRSQTPSRPRSFTEKINYFVSGGGLKYDLTSAANNYQQKPELRCRPRSFNDRLNLAVNRSSEVEIISFRPRSTTDKTIHSVKNSSALGSNGFGKGFNVTRDKPDNQKASANSLRAPTPRSGPLAGFRFSINNRWNQLRKSFTNSRSSAQSDFTYIDDRPKNDAFLAKSVAIGDCRTGIESDQNYISNSDGVDCSTGAANDISLDMSFCSDAPTSKSNFVHSSRTASQRSLASARQNKVTVEIGGGLRSDDDDDYIESGQDDSCKSEDAKVEHCRTLSDFQLPSDVSLMNSLRSQINGAFQTNHLSYDSQDTLNNDIPCLDTLSRGASYDVLSASKDLVFASTSNCDIEDTSCGYSSRLNNLSSDVVHSKAKEESTVPPDKRSSNHLSILESNYIVPIGKYRYNKEKQSSINELRDLPTRGNPNINDAGASNNRLSKSCFELEKGPPRSDTEIKKDNKTDNVIYHSIGCF